MKRFIIFFSFSLFLCLGADGIQLFAQITPCECGTHATGIYTYDMTGEDCCVGTPSELGFYKTYEPAGPGIWRLVETVIISGNAARDHCCPPA
ncbi:MAG: hypothetical protein AAFR61_01075 [Bacteroidota bacterium]